MFKLVIEDDDGNRTVVPVIRDEISIGRRKGNTIRLNERNVSRDHAKLIRDSEGVFIEDINSRYHTFCNGIPVDGKVPFNLGDVFSIGDYVLSLQSDVVAQIEAKPKASELRQEGTEVVMTAPGRLVVTSSNFAGQGFPLSNKEMIIGRGEDCDIIIDHRSVSTRHAKVVRDANGGYQIIDLNSKNGIKVSGEEYKSSRLKRGDTIEMGHVRFRFVEPGENYVFTPQANFDYDDFEESSSPKWILPVIGLVLVGLLAGGFFMFKKPADDPIVTPKAEKVHKSSSDIAKNNENIDTIIDNAKGNIKAGEIDKAIAKLETAKLLSPDSGRTAQIEQLLSDAVIWSSLAKSLDRGREDFKNERYESALEKFKKISADPSTPIYSIMAEEGLPKKALVALMKKAKKAKKSGDSLAASKALDAILLYDFEHASATLLKSSLDKKQIALNDKEEVSKFEKKKKTKKETKKKTNKFLFSQDLERGQEQYEQALRLTKKKNFSGAISACKSGLKNGAKKCRSVIANAIHTQAMAMMMRGNNQGAISKCRSGLKYGARKCNHVLGVSYKNLNNIPKACKYFKRAGRTPKSIDCD